MILALSLLAMELRPLLLELAALLLLPEFYQPLAHMARTPIPATRLAVISATSLVPAGILYVLHNHKSLRGRQG